MFHKFWIQVLFISNLSVLNSNYIRWSAEKSKSRLRCSLPFGHAVQSDQMHILCLFGFYPPSPALVFCWKHLKVLFTSTYALHLLVKLVHQGRADDTQLRALCFRPVLLKIIQIWHCSRLVHKHCYGQFHCQRHEDAKVWKYFFIWSHKHKVFCAHIYTSDRSQMQACRAHAYISNAATRTLSTVSSHEVSSHQQLPDNFGQTEIQVAYLNGNWRGFPVTHIEDKARDYNCMPLEWNTIHSALENKFSLV